MAEHRRIVPLLLVEDSPYFADLIGEFLSICDEARFEVVHVTTLKEAKLRLDDISAALVLSDVRLPDADTQQLFTWIADQAGRQPIVLMTGLLAPQLCDQARRSGCADCVDKDDLMTVDLGSLLLAYIADFQIDDRL